MTTPLESYLSALACVREIITYHVTIGHRQSHMLNPTPPRHPNEDPNWAINLVVGTDRFSKSYGIASFANKLVLSGDDVPDVEFKVSDLSPLQLNTLICTMIFGGPEIPAPSRAHIRAAQEGAVAMVARELQLALDSGKLDAKFFAREDEAEVWEDIVDIARIEHPYAILRIRSVPSYLVDAFEDVYYEAASEAIGAKCEAARQRAIREVLA